MSGGAGKSQAVKAEAGALEPYHRLIELQKQIIELVEQNEKAERQCAALREQLEREADAFLWSRRATPARLRLSVAALLGRLLRRPAEERKGRAAAERFKPDSKNWACAWFGAQSSQE